MNGTCIALTRLLCLRCTPRCRLALLTRDRVAAGTTVLVDRGPGAGGPVADDSAVFTTISGDGTKVAFLTGASNLGAQATSYGLWLRDLLHYSIRPHRLTWRANAASPAAAPFAAWVEAPLVLAWTPPCPAEAAD